MKKITPIFLALSLLLASSAAVAQEKRVIPPLRVTSTSFKANDLIPTQFAYCAPDGSGSVKDGGNVNPQLSWSGAPPGTKSFAIAVSDFDMPEDMSSVNKPGKIILKSAKRRTFYHWVMTEIPPNVTSIEEGSESRGVLPTGKPVGRTKYGRNWSNGYATIFEGTYGGYDGPCPPWNDDLVHQYHFAVFALDVESPGDDPATLEDNIVKHTLAFGSYVGLYTTNPKFLTQ